jgi:hypothetical protein
VIDLTGLAGASLTFAEALDLEAGDTALVNIIGEATDTVLIAAVYTADDSGGPDDADWNTVPAIDLSAAAGQKVRIEWCFSGTTEGYLGGYIDDVLVTATAPWFRPLWRIVGPSSLRPSPSFTGDGSGRPSLRPPATRGVALPRHQPDHAAGALRMT